MKGFWGIICFLLATVGYAQEIESSYVTKTIVPKAKIQLDSVPINSSFFELNTVEGEHIASTKYQIDFENATLFLNSELIENHTALKVSFLRYPEFLTRRYSALNPNLIMPSNSAVQQLYQLEEPERKQIELFDGLQTSGSIVRGITVGNNQSAVVNSQLDLQISGELGNGVRLTAAIKDDNIPIQDDGYSQRLQEFDQVYITLEGERWKVTAGDVNLENQTSKFLNFQKKVQGIHVAAQLGERKQTEVFASGAMVRGRYSRSTFTGQEGNQGPYKLFGSNNELYVLIVSGSERVYVNGIQLTRGENNDYVIDYASGEIVFTAQHPITSDMRINVEYQYTDTNYNRFVTYNGGGYKGEKLQLQGYYYLESDFKNQPLQLSLSEAQIATLSNAGDDSSQMLAPSAIAADFDENRVQYEQQTVNGVTVYVYSTNQNAQLYNVTFTYVGTGEGDYSIVNTLATGKVMEYVGSGMGDYAAVNQLVAPTQNQVAVVSGRYTPSEKTEIDFETAVSTNDQNLFSSIDDEDNTDMALAVQATQALVKTEKSQLNVFGKLDYIGQNFQSIERIYNIEFNRDWNLETLPNLNQQLVTGGIQYQSQNIGTANYQVDYLNFEGATSGIKHSIQSRLHFGKLSVQANGSALSTDGIAETSDFYRWYSRAAYSFSKAWVGVRFNSENNQIQNIATELYDETRSQAFKEYTVFTGIGDSTAIFTEIGYTYRVNDSIHNNRLQRFNTSNTVFVNSRWIQNENTQLQSYISYRNFAYDIENSPNEKSLNSRIQYNQKLFKGGIQYNATYETGSGTIAQQDFSYVEVDAGQGIYTWIDYNNNGVKEIEEFEVAQFQDQANYVRVFLPNQFYIKTHQNKLSQTLTVNPAVWSTDHSSFWAHFYNQTSYLTDKKIEKQGDNFILNPFQNYGAELLGLNESIRNVLFFNRGKQQHTTSYTYINTKAKTQLSVGAQENKIFSHQLQWQHKVKTDWIANFTTLFGETETASENYESRNYTIENYSVEPKITYVFSNNSRFDVSYEYQHKENIQTNEESLEQHHAELAFNFTNKQKFALNTSLAYYKNKFVGNSFSPVGYQILEGLQPGNNFTWTVFLQKQLTKFLDLNLNYNGRKSETSRTIHTGSVQLKAYF